MCLVVQDGGLNQVQSQVRASRPNILFITADDLGLPRVCAVTRRPDICPPRLDSADSVARAAVAWDLRALIHARAVRHDAGGHALRLHRESLKQKAEHVCSNIKQHF